LHVSGALYRTDERNSSNVTASPVLGKKEEHLGLTSNAVT